MFRWDLDVWFLYTSNNDFSSKNWLLEKYRIHKLTVLQSKDCSHTQKSLWKETKHFVWNQLSHLILRETWFTGPNISPIVEAFSCICLRCFKPFCPRGLFQTPTTNASIAIGAYLDWVRLVWYMTSSAQMCQFHWSKVKQNGLKTLTNPYAPFLASPTHRM